MSPLSGAYLITDTNIQGQYSHVELADIAFKAGVPWVQYRGKNSSDRKALQDIRAIAELDSKKEGQLLIINDRPDLAKAGGADGVHLGQDDFPIPIARKILGNDMVIGGTSSNLKEARQVASDGADYVALGHIFATSTKYKKYEPLGLKTLQEVAQAVEIPLVAIGGITLQNAADVIAAGADMIAVSSAICAVDNPAEAAGQFSALFK